MRHYSTLTAWTLVPLAMLAIALSGCIERSVVIKVKKDGSGVVHLRSHQQQTTLLLSIVKTDSQDDESSKPELSQQQVDKFTAALGPGVRLKTVKETTNRNGWNGHDVIWEFDDINELVLSHELLGDDESKASRKKPAKAKNESGYRFTMDKGDLQIHPYDTKKAVAATVANEPVGAVDPFAGKSSSSSVGEALAQQVMAKALADMRVGVYVQIDGEIESSNAKHRQESLITLVNIEMGELLNNPKLRKQLDKLSDQKQSLSAIAEVADQIDGISVDFQDPIRVRIR